MSKNFKVNDHNLIPDIDDVDSDFNFFDEKNPDIGFFNIVDDEIIRLSGSKLKYYKYFQSKANFDTVYMEERSKPVAVEPIMVHGHYDPRALDETLSNFGVELTNDQVFTFNKDYISAKLGRGPIPGDIIEPNFQNQKYEIFEVQEDSFELYGVYHYTCAAKLLRDASDVQRTPLLDTSDNLTRKKYITSITEDLM